MPSFDIIGGRPGSLLLVVGGPADPFPFRFSIADFFHLNLINVMHEEKSRIK